VAGFIYRRLSTLAEAFLPQRQVQWLRRVIRRRRVRRNEKARARREERWGKQPDGGNIVVRLQSGVRMRLYRDSVLCRYIYLDNFESAERQFVNAFLKPGDVFVDVGANVGLFTLIAARQVGKRGYVYAFEPSGPTFERLRENIYLNRLKNVSAFRLALSDSEGTMELLSSKEGLDAWNSFAPPYIGEEFSGETVPARTWDTFVRENRLSGRVTMMKIDVEGWEGRVLRGAERELARPDAPVLQVEFTDEAAQAAGFSCRDLYGQLTELGYEVCRFDSENGQLVSDPIRAQYPYCNLFAVKDRQAAQHRLNAGLGIR